MEIANIFWHGELTKLERASIKSFIDHGFHVRLWSYNNLKVEGAESCDASLVIPEDKMFDITPRPIGDKVLNKARATNFSDMFRYYLVNKFDGWWFDADAICLKDAEEFAKLREKEVVAGYLERVDTQVNGAVLYITKEHSTVLLREFEEFMADENRDASWGSYGPAYFTTFLNKHNLTHNVLPYTVFYAINWNEFSLFTDWQLLGAGRERLKDSYIAHVWNTEFELRNLDKNNPPIGSLLEELIDK